MITATVTKTTIDDKGIVEYKGEEIALPGLIAGEKIKIRILPKDKGIKAEEIIEKSNRRITPPCPYYLDCRGCYLQHLSYEDQLNFKEKRLKISLKT